MNDYALKWRIHSLGMEKKEFVDLTNKKKGGWARYQILNILINLLYYLIDAHLNC